MDTHSIAFLVFHGGFMIPFFVLGIAMDIEERRDRKARRNAK